MTTVINFIGGPGVGKTAQSCLCFSKMKFAGINCEYVSEYAKDLVWQNRLNELNNQYQVSFTQYQKLSALNDRVDYIITDGSLYKDLYYNRFNADNVANVDKTEMQILTWANEFNNLNIFIERDLSIPYEGAGRLQTHQQAVAIDAEIKSILDEHKIPYLSLPSQELDILSKLNLNNSDRGFILMPDGYFRFIS